MLDWHGTRAFAAWETIRTGQPWGLPGELAWEKAVRGVDGRFYPWGDGFDPSWASMRRSQRDRVLLTAVGASPVDEGPYGIRNLAGSMQDWCGDVFAKAGPPAASARHAPATVAAGSPAGVRAGAAQGDVADAAGQASARVGRGGSWSSPASFLRASFRFRIGPSLRRDALGFRLARSFPWPLIP